MLAHRPMVYGSKTMAQIPSKVHLMPLKFFQLAI